MTKLQLYCKIFGDAKNLDLPAPEPPITRMLQLRLVPRLSIASRISFDMIILLGPLFSGFPIGDENLRLYSLSSSAVIR